MWLCNVARLKDPVLRITGFSKDPHTDKSSETNVKVLILTKH
jgi:hypothetical protein